MAKAIPGIIAVGNLKGGAGKTTLAVNIASALASRGAVVLVDADAQATSMAWGEAGKLPVTLEALPLADDGKRALAAWVSRLMELRLSAAFVVVDLPPNLGGVTMAALTVTDLFMVPVSPSGMDLRATEKALQLLRQARQVRKGEKPACLLVPSRVDRRTLAGKEIEGVLSDFREPVGPAISQRAAHVDAFGAGQWIGAYAPRSAGHVEIEALTALARRMASR